MVSDETISLVEDNPDDELLTRRTLKKNNVCNEVVVAQDGAQTLDYLFGRGRYEWQKDPDAVPQVILLDLDLPKVDGLEVLRCIRSNERTKRLPIVILTSSEDQQDLVESHGLGTNGYVRKPLDLAQFRTAVQKLGLYWVVLNEASGG
jgi:two-component system, response regulator